MHPVPCDMFRVQVWSVGSVTIITLDYVYDVNDMSASEKQGLLSTWKLFQCTHKSSKINRNFWRGVVDKGLIRAFGDKNTFCQFVLDPASFNLKQRIHLSDPILGALFELSRDYCFAVNAERQKILGRLQKQKGNSSKSWKFIISVYPTL